MEQIVLTELYSRIENLAKANPKFGSVKGLEIAVGLNPSVIQKWKSHSPAADKLLLVAQALNVPMEYLLTGKGATNQTSKKLKKKLPEDNDEIPYSENPRDIMNKTKVAFVRKYDERNKHTFYLPVNTQCPICHHDNQPKPIDFQPFDQNKANQSCDMVGILLCTHCHHTYSVLYKEKSNLRTNYVDYVLKQELPVVDSCYTPYQPPLPEIPEIFDKTNFAKFQEAYKDVGLAESFGIIGLVGMAYRRAVEFLIKDFAALRGITLKENDKERWLKNIIEDLPDKRIMAFAASTNILANDYTHYAVHQTNRDIEDIKKFFNMLLLELQKELEFGDALTIDGIEKYKGLQSQAIKITKTTADDKKNLVTEFARTYEDLIQDESFRDTAKLFNYYSSEEIRTQILEIIIDWLAAYIQKMHIDYKLPNDILGRQCCN